MALQKAQGGKLPAFWQLFCQGERRFPSSQLPKQNSSAEKHEIPSSLTPLHSSRSLCRGLNVPGALLAARLLLLEPEQTSCLRRGGLSTANCRQAQTASRDRTLLVWMVPREENLQHGLFSAIDLLQMRM